MTKNKSNETVVQKKQTGTTKKKISGKRKPDKSEILLTEYKEIIQTLRNWDTVVYGMLTVVGTIAAAMVAYSSQTNNRIEWGVIISLFLFWLFTYLWITKLGEVRIDVLIEIENELGMVGQYSRLRDIKKLKRFAIWVFFPYIGAFIVGPVLGRIIADPSGIIELFQNLFR